MVRAASIVVFIVVACLVYFGSAAAAKKLPLTAYFDNRFVNELEKEGFFKRLLQ